MKKNEKEDQMLKNLLDSTTIGILGKIVEFSGCTQEELTQKIIAELVEDGFITIENGIVEITETGKKVLENSSKERTEA
jgi:predicted transcriptional regulator